jgi:hypothetical protein
MAAEDLIAAFLSERSPFSSIQVTGTRLSGEDVLVNINHGDYERTENYPISVLDLLEFIWDKSLRNNEQPEGMGDGLG